MIILADRNITGIEALCRPLGDVVLFDARDRAGLVHALAQADVLLCRSTIRVDAALLGESRVRFVATATAGIDHVDTGWLAAQGIAFASAAGSNARSVAEYVFAALYALSARGVIASVQGCSIGIIGAGHVGSEVAAIARALGMGVVLNDPPLEQATGGGAYRPLEDALRCDIVTLHVPLTAAGGHPTVRMMHAETLARMAPGALLVNTSRGGVVDESAVIAARRDGRLRAYVADVFAHEPEFDPAYAAPAAIATPHIAGHAWDGKLRGTVMVHAALCAFLGVPENAGGSGGSGGSGAMQAAESGAATGPAPRIPGDLRPALHAGKGVQDADILIDAAIRHAYDITADDAALRHMCTLPDGERGRAFATHRAEYPVRREFGACLLPETGLDPDIRAILRALGFAASSSRM